MLGTYMRSSAATRKMCREEVTETCPCSLQPCHTETTCYWLHVVAWKELILLRRLCRVSRLGWKTPHRTWSEIRLTICEGSRRLVPSEETRRLFVKIYQVAFPKHCRKEWWKFSRGKIKWSDIVLYKFERREVQERTINYYHCNNQEDN